MDQLIPLINRVQDALGTLEYTASIPFPRIVVVGAQSSGKSSVLESLVGRDFLPRGTGIVTRRPLILRLEHSSSYPEYGVFEHKAGIKFTDFYHILREIEFDTDRLVGKKYGISDEPIKLTIVSPNVIDITLVDLPGLTKNPVGDQPHNICKLIEEMVLKFITDKNSIILAVTAANIDLASSDSLEIARKVDPNGLRTLGVITKIDLMDRGTNVVEVLQGKQYTLSMGYIGVVCRSQSDINNKKKLSAHIQDEQNFFSQSEVYRPLLHKLGIPYLAKTLNEILKKHIITTLPELRKRIHESIRASDLELRNYGMPLGDSKQYQGVCMLNFISKYCLLYNKMIDGRTASSMDRDLNGGAQIRYFLFTKYVKLIEKINPFENMTEQDIRTAIINSTGIRANYLIPQEALEFLIKMQIRKLKEPSIQALNQVLEYLKKFASQISIPEYIVFENLKFYFTKYCTELLENCFEPAAKFIEGALENELSYINLSHPGLIKPEEAKKRADSEYNDQMAAKKLDVSQNKSWWKFGGARAPENAGETETKEVMFTKQIVISYFDLMKKNFSDYTIKAIMTYLVKQSQDKLHQELISKLYNEERFQEILVESPEISSKRTQVLEKLDSLRKASVILEEIRDL